jgi:hypothetical protein
VPYGVVIVISTVPADSVGAVALMDVALVTVKVLAAEVPNFTIVAPVNPEPVMVTNVPPLTEPDVGEIPVTAGIAA